MLGDATASYGLGFWMIQCSYAQVLRQPPLSVSQRGRSIQTISNKSRNGHKSASSPSPASLAVGVFAQGFTGCPVAVHRRLPPISPGSSHIQQQRSWMSRLPQNDRKKSSSNIALQSPAKSVSKSCEVEVESLGCGAVTRTCAAPTSSADLP